MDKQAIKDVVEALEEVNSEILNIPPNKIPQELSMKIGAAKLTLFAAVMVLNHVLAQGN